MKNTALLICLGTSTLLLSACVTGNSASQYQPTLTHAAMITNSSSCQEIAYNIEAMDRILINTGYGQTAGYNYSSHYANQAVHTGLAASGASYKAPYASSIVNMATSTYHQSSAQANQQNNQTGAQANQQKARLISLYQQKQC
jgi:hypothetical protein